MERKIDVNREGYTRMKVKKEKKIREWREPNKQSTTGTTRHDDMSRANRTYTIQDTKVSIGLNTQMKIILWKGQIGLQLNI